MNWLGNLVHECGPHTRSRNMIHTHGLADNVADQPGQKTWLVDAIDKHDQRTWPVLGQVMGQARLGQVRSG